MSDQTPRPDKAGYMLMNKPDYPRVPSWPDFMWIILLMMLFITVVLWAISLVAYAPLEEIAEWAKTPNPAKAPWYFIGLQELLVYFDPWIAGVLLPQQILIGLALIPYVDVSPQIQGRYAFEGRKFAVTIFTVGAIFWFVLILVGQFLRGPSWAVYWPIIDYDLGSSEWVRAGAHYKEAATGLESMSLGTGLALLLGFSGVGMIAPLLVPRIFPKAKWAKAIQEYIDVLGPIKYFVVQSHVVMIAGTIGKIILRLVFNIKYVVETPWFNI